MTLSFPNRSRSFDESRNCIRFTGYDGMFEVPFLVETSALRERNSETEASCLAAFDAARVSILDVARDIYANSRQKVYVIKAVNMS